MGDGCTAGPASPQLESAVSPVALTVLAAGLVLLSGEEMRAAGSGGWLLLAWSASVHPF